MPSAPYPQFNGSEPCKRDPNSWVPKEEDGPVAKYAKAHCGACHVKDACLAWGLANDEVGIYGGTTTAERARLRRAKGITPAKIRTTTVADVHALRAQGFTIPATAAALGIHPATVSKYRAMSPA